jgi:hypothetical protein
MTSCYKSFIPRFTELSNSESHDINITYSTGTVKHVTGFITVCTWKGVVKQFNRRIN